MAEEKVEFATLAEGAYNTLAAMSNFKNSHGELLVAWADTDVETKRAWEAVVTHIVDTHEATKVPAEPVSRFASAPSEPTDGEEAELQYGMTPTEEDELQR